MSENETETDQEDILAITEELSNDLSVENDTSTEEDQSTENTETEEDAEAVDTETDSDEEVPEAEDTDETDEGETEDQDETEDADETDPTETQDSVQDDLEQESDNSEDGLNTEDSVEPEIAENANDELTAEDIANLVQENEQLKAANEQLRKALHRTLAERVVDTKIALGLEELASRNELVENHAERSASSLADSLRDLAKIPPVNKQSIVADNLEVEQTLAPVSDTTENVVEETIQEEIKQEPKPADQFVEKMAAVLSGKTNLH